MNTCKYCGKQRQSALTREFACGECTACLCYYCSNIPTCKDHKEQFQDKVSEVSINITVTKYCCPVVENPPLQQTKLSWSIAFHRLPKQMKPVPFAGIRRLHTSTNAQSVPVKFSFVNTVELTQNADVMGMFSRPKSAQRNRTEGRLNLHTHGNVPRTRTRTACSSSYTTVNRSRGAQFRRTSMHKFSSSYL